MCHYTQGLPGVGVIGGLGGLQARSNFVDVAQRKDEFAGNAEEDQDERGGRRSGFSVTVTTRRLITWLLHTAVIVFSFSVVFIESSRIVTAVVVAVGAGRG